MTRGLWTCGARPLNCLEYGLNRISRRPGPTGSTARATATI
jgi:hypothetical protein